MVYLQWGAPFSRKPLVNQFITTFFSMKWQFYGYPISLGRKRRHVTKTKSHNVLERLRLRGNLKGIQESMEIQVGISLKVVFPQCSDNPYVIYIIYIYLYCFLNVSECE
jgi:hypothetical protein